ncbi:MAG TPA: hypothetical protein VGU90_18180 [Terriglobales bacterium]|nr:hypothetical protein [Terriglobales bacterium]
MSTNKQFGTAGALRQISWAALLVTSAMLAGCNNLPAMNNEVVAE